MRKQSIQVCALATLYAFSLGSKIPRQVFNVCADRQKMKQECKNPIAAGDF